jgi:hypothetical protein
MAKDNSLIIALIGILAIALIGSAALHGPETRLLKGYEKSPVFTTPETSITDSENLVGAVSSYEVCLSYFMLHDDVRVGYTDFTTGSHFRETYLAKFNACPDGIRKAVINAVYPGLLN